MKKRILQLIQLILVGVILFSGYRIVDYFWQRKRSDDQFSAVNKSIQEFQQMTPKEDGNKNEKQDNKTVDYRGMMARLKETNADSIGYIDIAGTECQYPVVLGPDNDYYLYRGLDEEWSIQGTPFLDVANQPNLSDRNTVIYAHMMYTGETMFSSLRHFLEQEYTDTSPKTFTITNEEGVHHYRIIAAYRVSADAAYRTPNPSDEEWLPFLKETYQNSTTKFCEMPEFQMTDRIVTLSTCTPEHDASLRVAVVGLYEKTDK